MVYLWIRVVSAPGGKTHTILHGALTHHQGTTSGAGGSDGNPSLPVRFRTAPSVVTLDKPWPVKAAHPCRVPQCNSGRAYMGQ